MFKTMRSTKNNALFFLPLFNVDVINARINVILHEGAKWQASNLFGRMKEMKFD